jgi:hypothetical protein
MICNIIRFGSSFAGLLADSTILDIDSRVEDVRTKMTEAVAPHLMDAENVPDILIKIAKAGDVQTLWYLRSDLLNLISEQVGERSAHQKLLVITEMFRGLVPDRQMPKPNRFNKW